MLRYPVPRWYQELSIPQMQGVFALGAIIKCDNDETVTGRTQKSLREIGIVSTFVKISSKELKKLYKVSGLDPVRFLCEIYRHITGNYFEDEGYKKSYDCNERIVLTAIAFLKFPETIIELHERLPMGKPKKLPKRPKPQVQKPRKSTESPYLDEVIEQHDWREHRTQLQKWREKVNAIVKPLAILPDINHHEDNIKSISKTDISMHRTRLKKKKRKRKRAINTIDNKKETSAVNIEQSLFAHDSIDDFSELDSFIKNQPKKFYPPGRENLSRKWQCWLRAAEVEFEKLEKTADNLVDGVREITRLIYNPNACDKCCCCKQFREIKSKKEEATVPILIIDSLILDNDLNKYVIGSLTLNSPISNVSKTLLNTPQIIPSEDKIFKTKIHNGLIRDENGFIRHIYSEITEDVMHVQKKIRHLPMPINNVPPCICKRYKEIEETSDSGTFSSVNSMCVRHECQPREFIGCKNCTDEYLDNKIYRDFEEACKKQEHHNKIFKKKVPIDHSTCTKRLFCDDKPKIVVESEPEKCTKCLETHGKCQENFLSKIIDQIAKEKSLTIPKISKKSEKKFYRDNIKFSIGGITKVDNDNNKITDCLLSGITLHTPITITPVSSVESDLSQFPSAPHHHWSVTAFTPKPKISTKKKTTSQHFIDKTKKKLNDSIRKALDELYSQVQQLDLLKKNINDQIPKNNEKEPSILGNRNADNDSERKIVRQKGGGNDEANIDEKAKKKKKTYRKNEFTRINEKMAEEGFLLAKLPDCHKIPQLQAWIMFREGFVINRTQRSALVERTQHLWNQTESPNPASIVVPSMKISARKRGSLTHTDIRKIEQELKFKKKIYHSKVRQFRVLESRTMWNLMDYQLFPSLAFKQAYFVYQASKESDGFIVRPYGFSRS